MASICDALLAREIVIIIVMLLIMWYITGKMFDRPSLDEGFEGSIDYDYDTSDALVQYTDDKINKTVFDMAELIPEDPRTALKTKSFDYNLDGGTYGDVMVYTYGPHDVPFRSQWGNSSAIYLPNSMLWHENTNKY